MSTGFGALHTSAMELVVICLADCASDRSNNNFIIVTTDEQCVIGLFLSPYSIMSNERNIENSFTSECSLIKDRQTDRQTVTVRHIILIGL